MLLAFHYVLPIRLLAKMLIQNSGRKCTRMSLIGTSEYSKVSITNNHCCSAYEIIRLKGYTSWGIGQSIGSICYNVLRNTRAVCALSTNVKVININMSCAYHFVGIAWCH
jgi:malate/lactate dehydrogenase